MTRPVRRETTEKLAIDGGEPALSTMPTHFLGASMIGEEERRAVLEVIESASLFRYYGPNLLGRVATFEEEFASRLQVPHALAVSSGTAALRVAYAAAGLRAGDEILIPAYSFLACPTSALTCGVVPVFVECGDSLLIDPMQLERHITPRTRAVLAVHMNGAACDLAPLLEIADKHDLCVIEDCSQAVGATYRGREVGTFGKIGTFSLQYMKTLCAGEGGVVVTSDLETHRRAVYYHDLGFHRGGRDGEALVGENLRMAELPAAVALVQFRRLDSLLEAMRRIHARLRQEIVSLPGMTPRSVPDHDGDSCNSLVFAVADNEKATLVRKALRAENVPCDSCRDKIGYLYPVMQADPLSLPFWNDDLGVPRPSYRAGLCGRTEELAFRFNAIPVGPSWTEGEVEGIALALRKVSRISSDGHG